MLLLFACLNFHALLSQTYFTNTTVIDVVNKKLIPGQTVVVKGDLISAMGSSKTIKVPLNATVINGEGKFLMPGLTDSHVHFAQSGGLYTRPDAIDLRKERPYEQEISWVQNNMEDLLRRYLQAGITTVIDAGAPNNLLRQRDSFLTRKNLPSIFMAGPLLTSWEPPVYKNMGNNEPFTLVNSVEHARKMVQEQLQFRPDFIKIWFIVDQDSAAASAARFAPVVRAVVDEAHKNQLKVAVHATESITARYAVESGCDFLVHSIEDQIVPDELIQLLIKKKVVLCPTLIVADGYYKTFGQRADLSYHDLTKSNPEQIGTLSHLKHLPDTTYISRIRNQVNSPAFVALAASTDSIRKANLKKMSDAGVIIAAGTDAGNIGTQHASSYINELRAMQGGGLTTWQVLQSATIHAARIFSNAGNTGSIAAGKKANMLLLSGNPAESLQYLTDPLIVVNKGHLIDPDTLIKENPLALVQRQLNAYNARNIEAFLEPYSDDVELYSFPDSLTSKGKENMRKRYAGMFARYPDLHCEIRERIVQGRYIIDKEIISGVNVNKTEATAIYYVENNKIEKVYFLR
jgi:imidazolonepropionase-like amidohydrolase